jgi:hypothetical protein
MITATASIHIAVPRIGPARPPPAPARAERLIATLGTAEPQVKEARRNRMA